MKKKNNQTSLPQKWHWAPLTNLHLPSLWQQPCKFKLSADLSILRVSRLNGRSVSAQSHGPDLTACIPTQLGVWGRLFLGGSGTSWSSSKKRRSCPLELKFENHPDWQAKPPWSWMGQSFPGSSKLDSFQRLTERRAISSLLSLSFSHSLSLFLQLVCWAPHFCCMISEQLLGCKQRYHQVNSSPEQHLDDDCGRTDRSRNTGQKKSHFFNHSSLCA